VIEIANDEQCVLNIFLKFKASNTFLKGDEHAETRKESCPKIVLGPSTFTCTKVVVSTPEPVFLNVYGAQESIPRNEFR
jgi:hypothetical protein